MATDKRGESSLRSRGSSNTSWDWDISDKKGTSPNYWDSKKYTREIRNYYTIKNYKYKNIHVNTCTTDSMSYKK